MNTKTKDSIIEIFKNNQHSYYDVKELTEISSVKEITDLNSTVNGHPNYGVFSIKNAKEKRSFIVAFTTYTDSSNYRMHIFSGNGQESLGEFHNQKQTNDSLFLYLKYKPSKRDGMNPKRKELFVEAYGNLIAKIHIQHNGKLIDDLVNYAVCRSTVNALLKPEQIFNSKIDHDNQGTEIKALINQRVGQDSLRKELLRIYSGRCAMCNIDEPKLLRASHIIPWSEEEKTRLDLRNAILLCGLHDLSFEFGHITLLPSFKIQFNQNTSSDTLNLLKTITRKKLRLPLYKEFNPKKEFLARHISRHETS